MALCFGCLTEGEDRIRELNLLERDMSLAVAKRLGFKTFCLGEDIDRIYPYKKITMSKKDFEILKESGQIYAEGPTVSRDVIQVGTFDKLEKHGIMCAFNKYGKKLIECSCGKVCFAVIKDGNSKGNLFQLTYHSLEYMKSLFNICGSSFDIEQIEGIDYND